MHIVFLNLADENPHGLAATTREALSKKYPLDQKPRNILETVATYLFGANQIEVVNLFGILQAANRRQAIDAADIPAKCVKADKVMLGVHGTYGDTCHVRKGDAHDTPTLATYVELATLTKEMLNDPSHQYRLALVMCYGARSADFRADHSDLTALSEAQIRSSFAFKFYSQVCTHCVLRMTAVTGSLSFSRDKGESQVQTEAAVLKDIEYAELQREERTAQLFAEHQQLVEEQGAKAISAIEDRLLGYNVRTGMLTPKPGAVAANDAERRVLAYYETVNRSWELKNAASGKKGKIGKLIYYYRRDLDKVIVMARYPEPEVIYSGRRSAE
ncbi:MAG: hypothetical protein ABSC93_04020 [Bryobacteraceae bacterium]|jgi:hypothetical protein